MLKKPMVSIIIPVYNGANYMKEAIDSALNQTYDNIEVIVINDGSNDQGETEKIALSYGDRIRYFYKENGGVSSALNLGIRMMKGDYFSWLSHDDVYCLNKIEKQIEIANMYDKENLLIYCRAIQIDKNSEKLARVSKANQFKLNKITQGSDVLLDLLKNGSLNGCALLIHRSVFFDNKLFFNENLRYAQDLLMWYQIFLKNYDLYLVNEELVKSRVHEKQLTQTGRAVFKKDSKLIGELLSDTFLEKSTKKYQFIYYYLRDNAKYGNKEVVKAGKKKARKARKITIKQAVQLNLWSFYGFIRPIIRKIYYRLFRKMKTN